MPAGANVTLVAPAIGARPLRMPVVVKAGELAPLSAPVPVSAPLVEKATFEEPVITPTCGADANSSRSVICGYLASVLGSHAMTPKPDPEPRPVAILPSAGFDDPNEDPDEEYHLVFREDGSSSFEVVTKPSKPPTSPSR